MSVSSQPFVAICLLFLPLKVFLLVRILLLWTLLQLLLFPLPLLCLLQVLFLRFLLLQELRHWLHRHFLPLQVHHHHLQLYRFLQSILHPPLLPLVPLLFLLQVLLLRDKPLFFWIIRR